MSATLDINSLLSKVKKLEKEEQFALLERILVLLKKEETQKELVKLSNISGIGSNI